MKKLTLATLLIFSCATACTGDFDKGLAAYDVGDYATALAELRPLAARGDAAAQFKLGEIYYWDEGVIKDDKEAAKWYRLAAEQGNSNAQVNLAVMYYKGQGVIQDSVYAHMWWLLAAASGNEVANQSKDMLVKDPSPQDISKAQDLARECVKKNYKDC